MKAEATEDAERRADGQVRERILAAALQVIRTDGAKALTQPRVAKAAGVRQSHLTYYFPRKADLFLAVFESSHQQAAEDALQAGSESNDPIALLSRVVFDRERARFFFSTLLEVCDEPELRDVVAAHARGLARQIAPYFGRLAGDPAVASLIDLLRGIALRMLMDPQTPIPAVEQIAASLGLALSGSRKSKIAPATDESRVTTTAKPVGIPTRLKLP